VTSAPITVTQAAGSTPAQEGPQPAQGRRSLADDVDEILRAIYTRSKIGWSQVVAVSSAGAGEGKTALSVGLAAVVAQDFHERRVVVVETALHGPVFARDFGCDATPGLIDCILGRATIAAPVRQTAIGNLWLMPSGGPPPGSERLLRGKGLADTILALREQCDLVVIDAPPILTDSDSGPVLGLADSVIIVARAGVTSAADVHRAIAEIDPQKLRGVVLNDAHSSIPAWLRGTLHVGER
jgi:tyrosine-protein kinase Etk/Wzc